MDQLQVVRPSFRDPAGTLVQSAGRVLRYVNSSGAAAVKSFLASPAVQQLTAEGKIVRTVRLESPEKDGSVLLEHERVPFPSYPYEWCPEMLREAGLLMLELAKSLLQERMGLKDATPFNILWRGPNPVFVDVLSFEQRHPRDATWLPMAQFHRTFVLPLLANELFSVPLNRVFLTSREGLEPEDLYRWAGSSLKWNFRFLTEVALPVWLGGRNKQSQFIYEQHLVDTSEKAHYILDSLFTRQSKQLARMKTRGSRPSAWEDYTAKSTHYSGDQVSQKNRFVEEVFHEFLPQRVLDIGCNTGHFSALAARAGASVVACDSDPVVVAATWERARQANLDILPLTINIANPSPASGWRNGECSSFLDRAAGAFDCVMLLAVVHHLLVTERIPLAEIVQLAAQLTTDLVILEFVSPEDPMFQRLTRGRAELHRDDSAQAFEHACEGVFEIVRSRREQHSHRTMYCLRKLSR